MPRPPLIVALLALAVTCGLVRTAEAAPTLAHSSAPRYVVHVAPGVDLGTARSRLVEAGLNVHAAVDCAQALVVDGSADDHALVRVAKLAGITGVEPDYPQAAHLPTSRPLDRLVRRTASTAPPGPQPNDEFFPDQWNLRAVSASRAWEYTTGATDALSIVAVLDTGIDLDHLDLGANVYFDAAWNFYDNTPDVQDISPSGSGTMVAGIIAAAADNGFGIAGLAWRPQIIPVKVIGWDAAQGVDVFYWSDIAAGICHAVNHGARVIHISAYHRIITARDALYNALIYANERGAIVVAPVGDEQGAGNPIEYPAANVRQVIGVGAVYQNQEIWEHSNTGNYVDLVAPGVDVVTTVPMSVDPVGARYGTGTLLAAAHVSGVALLMRSVNPVLPPAEIAGILRQTADDLGLPGGWDPTYGAGQVNAGRAVGATPHRLTISPADELVFEWDEQSQRYETPLWTVSNLYTSERTWRATATADWLHINGPSNAPLGSAPSLAAISVAPPQRGECNTKAAFVHAESQMTNKANGPQDILVRVLLPECAPSPFAVFLPLIQHAPPRPVNTSR